MVIVSEWCTLANSFPICHKSGAASSSALDSKAKIKE